MMKLSEHVEKTVTITVELKAHEIGTIIKEWAENDTKLDLSGAEFQWHCRDNVMFCVIMTSKLTETVE